MNEFILHGLFDYGILLFAFEFPKDRFIKSGAHIARQRNSQHENNRKKKEDMQ